ncbi:MAG: D-aminoacyl-tRNA deacylase [Acidimicrobiales bacterium]|nr:D-aminoacyl-tRNA deacylase [Acidimicrobiales bacterium]
MRALVQRVVSASVSVPRTGEGVGAREVIGSIGPGLCLLVGVTHSDDEATASRLAKKVWTLRVMADEQGAMNLSVAETTRQILVVSQFTLYGDTRRGRRPSWLDAARPEHAEPLVEYFTSELRGLGAIVATGRFGADMHVSLVNDGPVTLMVEV